MDFLIDFISELIFDTALNGAESAAGYRKLPKPVRYLILALIILVFAAVLSVVFLTGALMLRDSNYPFGIFMLALGAVMLFMSIRKFRILREKVRKPSAEGENKGEEI